MDEMTKASAVPHRPERRGFDAARFSGEAHALFERHLRFDSVVDPAAAGARDKFEAAARRIARATDPRSGQPPADEP